MESVNKDKENNVHQPLFFGGFSWIVQMMVSIISGLVYGLLFILGIALLLRCQIYYECGNSMEHTIHKGSLLIVKSKRKSNYDVGDIITFTTKSQGQTLCVTHRIKQKTVDGRYLTKGDANAREDREAVSKENIRGMVVGQIPYYGVLCRKLRKYGILLIFLFLLHLFGGMLK